MSSALARKRFVSTDLCPADDRRPFTADTTATHLKIGEAVLCRANPRGRQARWRPYVDALTRMPPASPRWVKDPV